MNDERHPPPGHSLSLAEFEDRIDRLGPHTERWPEAEAAARLLAESAEARALQRGSAELLARLDALPKPRPRADLQARILAAAAVAGPARGAVTADAPSREMPRRKRSAGTSVALLESLPDWLQAAVWRPALGAAASLLLGFALGSTTGQAADHTQEDTDYGDYMTLLSLQNTLIEIADDEP